MRNRELNVATLVRADVLTDRLQHPLATGNWVGGRSGVSQLLDRTDYISTLSHLRRVISPLSRAQPHFEARDLHPTQWGRLCPSETPEGPNCGLVKNFAQMVELSTGAEDADSIKNILHGIGVAPVELYVPEKILDYSADVIYAEELDIVPEETETVTETHKEDEYHELMDENVDPIGDDKTEVLLND
jgi:DNA-directed RNA polymerase subunit B"